MNILKLSNVSFSYKKCKVLNDISYCFEKGKIYSIIGHNGAGKTTLMRLCLKLIRLNKGKIEYFGKQVVSYVPDRGGLYEHLTVEQNIKTFLKLNNRDKKFSQTYLEESIKRWDLVDKRQSIVNKLSMGQKQRVSLIVALVNNPDIIFLDEPSNSIDINSQQMLIDYLLELKNSGKTIIMSSHDITLIEKVSDQIVVIDEHEIVFSDKLKNIKDLSSIYENYTELNDNGDY